MAGAVAAATTTPAATSLCKVFNALSCRPGEVSKAPSTINLTFADQPLAQPRHAFDRQPAAVAVEDVLDQRQAQPGAALRAALRYIDPIEALGQPRQMLGRDAGTAIAHGNARFRFAIRPFATGQRDVHPLAGRRVF